MATSLIFFFLAFTAWYHTSDARQLNPTESAQLDQFISEVMRCGRIPALGLSLVGDGEMVYTQGYGTANPSGGRAMTKTTADTVFCLGSATQAFTAVLLASLLSRNENKTFNTPLHEIIGSRVHLPGRYRTEFVNLKDILGMRTGLSNMDVVASAMGMNRFRAMENLRFAPEVAPFREENVFSEALFPLAEDAARALGQETWYTLMRQYIFGPLGMENAGFVHLDAKDNAKLAVPVVSYSGKHAQVPLDAYKGQEIVAAASSICASSSDMSKWLYFILGKGKNTKGQQVVTEEALMETFKSVQSRNGEDTWTSGFSQPAMQVSYTRDSNALGWIKGHYRGYPFVSQDGSLPGYESLTTILPKRNVGVFTAFTGDGGARAYAAKTLTNIFALDLLLHGQPWFDSSSVCKIMDKMVDTTRLTEIRPQYLARANEAARPLREYEGTYRDFGFGDVTVRRNDTDQVLRLEYGEMGKYLLYPSQKNDTFIMQADQGPLWFSTHADEFRNKGPYSAVFSNRYRDSSGGIENVIIPHFARDFDPEFSKYPRARPSMEQEAAAPVCDACVRQDISGWMVVTSVVLCALGLVR